MFGQQAVLPSVSRAARMCIQLLAYTHWRVMRTNIEIDDRLLAQAQAATGATTKKETVRLGLELLVRLDRQAAVRELRGEVHWDGDLDDLRRNAS
jgi:Arc/MetJ family transcription regulator